MGDCSQNSLNEAVSSMKNKDRKKKKHNSFMKDSVSSLPVDDACDKKNKHAHDRQTETDGICIYLEPNSENTSSKKNLKKKKKRRKIKMEDAPIDQTLVMTSSSKMNEQDIDQVSGQNQGTKKKKHKKQKNFDDNVNLTTDFTSDQAVMDAPDEIVTNKKKKKKKKHSEKNCTEAQLITETNILEPVSAHIGDLSKKKKKKKEKNCDKNNEGEKEVNEENIQDTLSSSKKNKKRKQNSNDTVSDGTLNGEYSDMNMVLKKKGRIGNTEGQGSTAMDPRCQLKIDEENTVDSDKTGMKEKTNESNQWVTASLGSEERDKKFLRLLGGFKKGTDSGSISFKTGAKGGNLAMNSLQENIYKKEMENVYEKAMSINLQRGLGLGYEPPPSAGKTFFIDKNKSKSIKFDD
ncbi:hypothetical protein ACJMK2_043699 [Sinanodonta woodiana]|uniref:Small acidic protein-like domain-containing protein n=1 Tax=Sinanodonta woodiana TaxID=1069815 RepID=A0ABD3W0X2_SINWO